MMYAPSSKYVRPISGNIEADGSGNEHRIEVTVDGFVKVILQAVDVGIGKVKIWDGTNLAAVETDSYQNLNTQNPLVVTGIIHGEDLDVGAGNSEPIKIRTDDGILPISEKHLVVQNLPYAYDLTDTRWVRLQAYYTYADNSPDLDGLAFPATHALLQARKDAATTIGLTCSDGTYNPLHVRLTDTSNFMPTMDVAARAGFVKITDGTDTVFVGAAGSGFAVTDKGLLVLSLFHAWTGSLYTALGVSGTTYRNLNVRIRQGGSELDLAYYGSANANTEHGILVFGMHYTSNAAYNIPVSYYTDALPGVAEMAVPVHIFTRERVEGTKITDGVDTLDIAVTPVEKTADGQVKASAGTLYGYKITFSGVTADDKVEIEDSLAAGGTVIFTIIAVGTDESHELTFANGAKFATGIFHNETKTGGTIYGTYLYA